MAIFKITEETTVADIKEQFKREVGGTLRVFNGSKKANDDDVLVNIGASTGEFQCRTSRTVGKFVEDMKKELNLKVKVGTKDDWVLVLDGVTLANISRLPNQTTKSEMESYVGYQRKDDSSNPNPNSENQESGEMVKKKLYIVSTDTWALSYSKITDEDLEKVKELVDEEKMDDQQWRDLFLNEYSLYYNNCIYALRCHHSPDIYESIEDIRNEKALINSDDLSVEDFKVDWDTDEIEFPEGYPEKYKSNVKSWVKKGVIDADSIGDAVMVEKLPYDKGKGAFALRAVNEFSRMHFETEIELKKGEKFDPDKFSLCLMMTSYEPEWIGCELDLSSTLGVIYDNKWYPMSSCEEFEDDFSEKDVYAAILDGNIFGEVIWTGNTIWKYDRGSL